MNKIEEIIIAAVYKYPLLYDTSLTDFKNTRKKEKVWELIGQSLGTSGQNLKKRWKSLKDCYLKHLRSKRPHSEQQAKLLDRYKTWPWAPEMSVFKKYLKLHPSELNESDEEAHADETYPTDFLDVSLLQFQESQAAEHLDNHLPLPSHEELEIIEHESMNHKSIDHEPIDHKPIAPAPPSENHISLPLRSVRPRKAIKRKTPEPAYEEELEKPVVNHQDEIDLIFLGYASTVKKFSPTRQAIVKFRIAQLLMEQEIEHYHQENETNDSSEYKMNNYKHEVSPSPHV